MTSSEILARCLLVNVFMDEWFLNSIDKKKKRGTGFTSAEIIYYALGEKGRNRSKLVRIFTDRFGEEGKNSASRFLNLLDILKEEGLIYF